LNPGLDNCPALFGPNGRANEAYSDGPIPATVSDQISLADSQEPVLSSFEVCVANYGSSAGDVDVQFPSSSVISSEVTCEPSEEQSEADACTAEDFANDPGELDQVLFVHAWMDFLDREVAGDFATFVAEPQYLFRLAPGEAKPVEFSIGHAANLSDDQKNIAQTDKVQWDAVFTLHDPLPVSTDESSAHA